MRNLLRVRRLISTMLASIFLFTCIFVAPPGEAGGSEAWGGPHPTEHEKYALLVGVSKYDRGSRVRDFDWWDLNVKNDLEILAHVLINRFQFKPENVRILADVEVEVEGRKIPAAAPTHKAIKEAFRASLTNRVSTGDIAYFHFSGHGQQVPDEKEDSSNALPGDETDGFDETIVPSDYVSQKDGSRNLRDDDIGALLTELDRKKPSNVTVTLDSCFSGTATRGAEIARGGPWKGDRSNSVPRIADESVSDFVSRGPSGRGAISGEQNYVFISAASPSETAKEFSEGGRTYGRFTYNLARAMDKAGPSTTYRDLHENLLSAMTVNQRDQTPQIEGNHLDKIVLKEGALPAQRFFPLGVRGSNVYLKAGKLQGMTKGSKFAVYGDGAKQHKDGEQIAIVQIERVNATTSTLRVVSGPSPERAKAATRAFEIEHVYDETLKVSVRGPAGFGGTFDEIFQKFGLIQLVPENSGSWQVVIRGPEAKGPEVQSGVVRDGFRGVILERRDGSIITAVGEGPDMSEAIRAALKREANWRLVKSFDHNSDPTLNFIRLEMIPIEVDFDEAGHPLAWRDRKNGIAVSGGKRELRAFIKNRQTDDWEPDSGEFVRLEIQNTGTEDVYVTILNLRSDGRIGPAFPIANDDNKISGGTTHRVPSLFRITEPFGEESYRAIVTRAPTDFTPLLDPQLLTRGVTDRARNASLSPLGILLRDAGEGKRGDPVAPPPSWSTTSVTFFVVPGKR